MTAADPKQPLIVQLILFGCGEPIVGKLVASYGNTLNRLYPCIGAIFVLFALVGCEVAQDRVYISTYPSDGETMFDSRPSQAKLVGTLQEFFALHGLRCRQHVKWWDEWSCAGPHSMRITFQPDRGQDRFIAEFTLVIRSDEYAADFRIFVDDFVEHMSSRFPEAVLYAAH